MAFFLVSCDEAPIEANSDDAEKKQLILYNWEDYTPHNILEQFEKETGIKVILKEFQTADEQIAVLQSKPDFCDLLMTDVDEAITILEPLKIIEKLDRTRIVEDHEPHALFRDTESYGVPYGIGLLGFAVDKRYVDLAFKDCRFLISDENFKGKISLLDEPVDVFYMLMNAVGISMNSESEAGHKSAYSFGTQLKKMMPKFQDLYSGLDDLNEGKVWIAMAYSGDALLYQEENSNIEFIYSLDRPCVWRDLLCLNMNAPNKENAYKFMEFINSPQVAAEIALQFKSAPAVAGAEKFMDRESLNNPLINMPNSLLRICEKQERVKENNAAINRLYLHLSNQSKGMGDD